MFKITSYCKGKRKIINLWADSHSDKSIYNIFHAVGSMYEYSFKVFQYYIT